MIRRAEVDTAVSAIVSGHVMVIGETGSGKSSVLVKAAAEIDPSRDNTYFVTAYAWSEARCEIGRFLEHRVSRKTPRLVVIDDIDFYVTTTGSSSSVLTDLRNACAPKTTGAGAKYLISSTRAFATKCLEATVVVLAPLPVTTLRRFCIDSSARSLKVAEEDIEDIEDIEERVAMEAASVAAVERYPTNLHMISRAIDDPLTVIDTSPVVGLRDAIRDVFEYVDPDRLSYAWSQHGVELVGGIFDIVGSLPGTRSRESLLDDIVRCITYYVALVSGRTEFQIDADCESVSLFPFAGSLDSGNLLEKALGNKSLSSLSSVIKARSTRVSRVLASAHTRCLTYSELEMRRP